MRYVILSDIHGNLDALTAVLKAAEGVGYDMILCLGDVVGYGAEPNECCRLLRERKARRLAGNHDHAAIGLLNLDFFNEFARVSAVWTREHLDEENVEWLRSAPFVEIHPEFAATHSTLHSPELFNYILTVLDARMSFDVLDRNVCFMGHSHMPVTFFSTTPITYSLDSVFEVTDTAKMLVNVGSVGQPRDEIPLACFCHFDTESRIINLLRVEYDLESAAQKIMDAGLPEILAFRLFKGK